MVIIANCFQPEYIRVMKKTLKILKMKNRIFCQSCSMPLDTPDLMGTEKDGSKNHDYCIHCYRFGAFTNPGLTLEEMKLRMMGRMDKEKIPGDILEAALQRLPLLRRWKTEDIEHHNTHIL